MTPRSFCFQISVLIAAVALMGCGRGDASAREPENRVTLPVFDLVRAGGPGASNGWNAVGSNPQRPALSLYQDGRPLMVLACEGTETRVQVRDLQPAQAWPQPDLSLEFGRVTRKKSPDVRNIGQQVAFEVRFGLADDVLDQIASGASLTVNFNGQSRTFEAIPDQQRRSFVQSCAALVPEGMRQAGA